MTVDTRNLRRIFAEVGCQGGVLFIEHIEMKARQGKILNYTSIIVDPTKSMLGPEPKTTVEFIECLSKVGAIRLGDPRGKFNVIDHLDLIGRMLPTIPKETLKIFDAACGESTRIEAQYDPDAGKA